MRWRTTGQLQLAKLGLWAMYATLVVWILAFLVDSWLGTANLVRLKLATPEQFDFFWRHYLLMPWNIRYYSLWFLYAIGLAVSLWIAHRRWAPGLWAISVSAAFLLAMALWRLAKVVYWLLFPTSSAWWNVHFTWADPSIVATTGLMATLAATLVLVPTLRWLLLSESER